MCLCNGRADYRKPAFSCQRMEQAGSNCQAWQAYPCRGKSANGTRLAQPFTGFHKWLCQNKVGS
jgi:hypothetical protein